MGVPGPRRFLSVLFVNVISWQCLVGTVLILHARALGIASVLVSFTGLTQAAGPLLGKYIIDVALPRGSAGLVLYSTALAAPAVLLAGLALVRQPSDVGPGARAAR